jgi:hypothetical protein
VNGIPPADHVTVSDDDLGYSTLECAVTKLAEVEQIRLYFVNERLEILRGIHDSLLGVLHPFERKCLGIVSKTSVMHP